MWRECGILDFYLLQGRKKCLIDAGTRREAPRLIRQLRELGAFPPDQIIVTHPHWDHTQGIPLLRQEAAKIGRHIEVFASPNAIPLLADQSFNAVFENGPYSAIHQVSPVQGGETIDLGGIRLKVMNAPGHCQGHLAILDETFGNIFVGDAVGDKLADDIFLPVFMPTTWDERLFRQSIETLKRTPYETLCLTHFGCVTGPEAHDILNEALETLDVWWRFFERHQEHLNDCRYLLRAMRAEIKPGVPRIRPIKPGLALGLNILIAVATLLGRRTRLLDRLYYGHAVQWLANGFAISRVRKDPAAG